MLNFNPVTRSDINKLQYYYTDSKQMSFEFSSITNFLWRNKYHLKYAIYKDTLIKGFFNEDDFSLEEYFIPIGMNVREALEREMEDAASRHQKFRIILLTSEQRSYLEKLYPNRFVYTNLSGYREYLYRTQDLIKLQGKQYQSKRNFITRFYKTYSDTQIKDISTENAKDVMRVVDKWCKEKGMNTEEWEEANIIREALSLLNTHPLKGIVLYVRDLPVATALGSEISGRVFDLNFEKALKDYCGLYAVIRHEFAKRLSQYEYINVENDLGIEGLRKAKLSWNPAICLDRIMATSND